VFVISWMISSRWAFRRKTFLSRVLGSRCSLNHGLFIPDMPTEWRCFYLECLYLESFKCNHWRAQGPDKHASILSAYRDQIISRTSSAQIYQSFRITLLSPTITCYIMKKLPHLRPFVITQNWPPPHRP
jgi:hypothetical protein